MEHSPLIFGLILQSSMIMALGAQNLFVIERGLLKDRALLVAMICTACDVSLIFLGVMGAGSFFAQNAILTLILKVAGALFLFKYAYGKFKDAGVTQNFLSSHSNRQETLKSVVLSSLAVSLLNPHVYLDTVVLIGGYSTKFPLLEERLAFAAGAGLFSALWFFTVSFGAGFFNGTLSNPKTMKIINYGTSAMMAVLGVNLLWTA